MCEYSCGGQKSTLGAILLVPPTSFIFLFYNIYLFIFYFMHMGVLCAHMSVHHTHACCHGDQKRELAALELELTVFVSYHVGAKSNLSSLEEQSTLLTTLLTHLS